MTLFLLLGVVFLVALGVIGFVVGAHWNELRLLDPATLKEEQERLRRESVIRHRFETWSATQLSSLRRASERAGQWLSKGASMLEAKARAWEQAVKEEERDQLETQPERLTQLMSEAKSFARDLKWADAERQYLEVLSIDAHNADAYKGLASIYLKQKQFDQARETLEYLVKMRKTDDTVYAGLADIEEAEGNEAKAEQFRKKALEENPNQPSRHVELAQYYLMHGRPQKALPLAEKACELDPKSTKFHELTLTIAIEAKNVVVARAMYDRLRLLSDDQTRFQTWRDKVEKLEAEGK